MTFFTFYAVLCLSLVGLCFSASVSGVFPSNFRVSAYGSTVDGSSFDIKNNTGTLVINGLNYTALAYWTQVMDTYGLRPSSVWWINIVGIAEDGSNLAIVYLDCTNGVLQNDYWEEDWNTFLASSSLSPEYVGQSCFFSLEDWNINVTMPVLDAIPTSSVDTDITITGDSINFNNNFGWMVFQGNNYTILPISTVNCWNCASNCGSYDSTSPASTSGDYCEPGPWYEIHHAAYYKSPSGESTICFGIFYLFHHDQSFVQWNYTFCTPSISSPMELYTNTEWEGQLPHSGSLAASWSHEIGIYRSKEKRPNLVVHGQQEQEEMLRRPMKEPRRPRGWRRDLSEGRE